MSAGNLSPAPNPFETRSRPTKKTREKRHLESLLVEPVQPFLGTVRLEGLDYRNIDLRKFYPYGEVTFP